MTKVVLTNRPKSAFLVAQVVTSDFCPAFPAAGEPGIETHIHLLCGAASVAS